MLKNSLKQLANGLLSRLGTATAAWLVTTVGVNGELAHQTGILVTGAGLVIADLLIGKLTKAP